MADNPETTITVKGVTYPLTADHVRAAVFRRDVEPIGPGSWIARIGRKDMGVRQVIRLALPGVRSRDVSLKSARLALRRLGYDVHQVPREG